ncbi:MAG: restriction endonuclease subunit S, partial [Nitrospirae bacterium]|nr:restriction endonuclease subunit S [Nitrospirota bacterium]
VPQTTAPATRELVCTGRYLASVSPPWGPIIQDLPTHDNSGRTKTFIDVKKEYSEIPKLKVSIRKVTSKSLLNTGDVVFVDASEDDEGASKHIVVFNSEGIPFISGLHTIVSKSSNDIIDNDYKRYCFQPYYVKSQFKFFAVGTKVTGISKTNIAKILIPLPSTKAEQTAIATALSDADALISRLEELIAKKRKIKQVAMQELLTGKKRLPGFSGEWKTKRLGDIFRVTRGQVLAMTDISKEKIGEYRYPVYSSQTLNNGLAGYFSNYLFEDCITWTTDGANAGDVKFRAGKFYCTNVCGVLESKEGYSNQCIAGIFNCVSKKYVSYVGNPKLMNNVVQDIRVRIPDSFEEQTAIAQILSGMDAEIEQLEQKAGKYRMIKQGMMQELLTGKTRLI